MKNWRMGVVGLIWLMFPGARADVAVAQSGDTDDVDFALATERARRLLEGHRRELSVPGMQVAVSWNGRVIWSEGLGLADIELGVPVNPSTRFRVGSVSKALTSAAVGVLVQNGQLDLDAPVRQYVPYWPEKRWPITSRQLGGHTSGIRHYLGREEAAATNDRYSSVESAISLFSGDTLLFEPGSQMHYSSYGFNLLSAVIEAAAGEPFLDFMQHSVFGPLGMRSTGGALSDTILPNRSSFYTMGSGGVRVNAPYSDLSSKWAGGGMMSTAEDLVGFISRLWAGDLVQGDARSVLFTSQETSDGQETGYGIGWLITHDEEGRFLIGHGGLLDGARAHLLYYPDYGLAVAILANTGDRIYFNEGEAREVAGFFLEVIDGKSSDSMLDWKGLWSFTMEAPEGGAELNVLMSLQREGRGYSGHLTVPDLAGGVDWTIPLAYGQDSTLRVIVTPGSHLQMTFVRTADSIAATWRFAAPTVAPGMIARMPPGMQAAFRDRGRERPIRSVGRADIARLINTSGPPPPVSEDVPHTGDDLSEAAVRYRFTAELTGNAVNGQIVLLGEPGERTGRVEAEGRPPLSILEVVESTDELRIRAERGMEFRLRFNGDQFEGTVSLGGNEFPVTGGRVR